MLDAGSPARAAGVHCFRAVTTKGTVAGLSFTSVAQLFSMAESRSTFLPMQLSDVSYESIFLLTGSNTTL